MGVPTGIVELIERFERNIEAYKSGRYNETQVRREFIDPFFTELGWDVANKQGHAEAYKDVIHEDAIRIGAATKAPDYCFRIGGTRKFFLEAKKPSINVKDEPSPAYQLRRYAWSAKLGLSILTDFEEFAVYDCRIKPVKTDRASTARVMLLNYKDYAERWDEIASIFSKDAVLRGSFDKYAESNKRKKGTAEVDDTFLLEIEEWRDKLARNLALRNLALNNRQLNFAVQKTIDRIIFLRICEDRGIERYGELQQLLNGANVYERLLALFRKADDRYNSGLFHFTREKDRPEGPDELTPGLVIDDKVLKDILRRLYYPESPYAFEVLPAEILGHVYEQFLGKVITLTAGHHAKIEEKPEVKKAGGVYYTPSYIVDYIVENTVGKLVEGKTPAQVAKLKILDPACGSGSFLLGAYQYLLDWHLKYYTEHDPEGWLKKKRPPICECKSETGMTKGRGALREPACYKLTTAERKQILLNNIYGVDIDAQAVEVTKLSLLLKVLEGEKDLALFHRERALPDLGNNIKCGNSLIGTDFYKHQQMMMFDEEEQYRINAFDWEHEFREIFSGKNPGFDAVIGNPPYRMLQPHNTKNEVLSYLRKNYIAAEFKIEFFHLFFQRGVSLLNNGGHHGYIVPTTILNNVYAANLRRWLMDNCCIQSISVAEDKVFNNADVHTSIVIQRKETDAKKRKDNIVKTTSGISEHFTSLSLSEVKQSRFDKLPGCVWNILINEKNAALITRLNEKYIRLGVIATINRGLITGAKDKFFSEKQISKEYVPVIAGGDVQRYSITPFSAYVLFKRPKTSGGCWDKEVHLSKHKIVIRQIGFKPTASILMEPIAVTGNIFTIRASNLEEELYLLGIINSKLIAFYWKIMFADFKTSFPQVTIFSLSQIPIKKIDTNDKADRKEYEQMLTMVNKMLDLNQRSKSAKTPNEKRVLERQIAGTDRAIDELVYELYGLTEEEIRIVEGGVEGWTIDDGRLILRGDDEKPEDRRQKIEVRRQKI